MNIKYSAARDKIYHKCFNLSLHTAVTCVCVCVCVCVCACVRACNKSTMYI